MSTMGDDRVGVDRRQGMRRRNDIRAVVHAMTSEQELEMSALRRDLRDVTEVFENTVYLPYRLGDKAEPCVVCEVPTRLVSRLFGEHLHKRCTETRLDIEVRRREEDVPPPPDH